MNRRSNAAARFASLAGPTLLGLVLSSQAAHAQYLDPGTGSYLFQLLIAGGTAVLYFVYRNKERVKRLFGKNSDEHRAG